MYPTLNNEFFLRFLLSTHWKGRHFLLVGFYLKVFFLLIFGSVSDFLKDFLSWSLNYYIESKIKFGKDKIIIFSMKLLVSYLMQRVTNQSRLQLKRVSSHSMVDCQTPKIVIRKNSIGYGGHVKLRLRASAGVWTGTWSAKVGGIGTGLKLKYVRT